MRWAAAGLWAAFALLVALGGASFLHGCGFGLGGQVWNYCPRVADDSDFLRETQRGEELRRQIHLAEMRLAEKPPCPAPTPKPVPPPAPTFRPEDHPSEKRNAHKGVVEVFLKWGTRDDIDLLVMCKGGGQIGGQSGKPGTCGEGRVDVDANRNLTENVSDTPEEHAVWASVVPGGELKVEATIFRSLDSNRRKNIPFEMTFKIGDAIKVCTGEVQVFPEAEKRRTKQGQTLSSYDPFLVWTPSQGLPTACDWQTDEAHYCGPGECEKK